MGARSARPSIFRVDGPPLGPDDYVILRQGQIAQRASARQARAVLVPRLEVSMRRCSALVAMALACVGGSWPRPALAYDRCDDIQVPFGFYANSPCVGD